MAGYGDYEVGDGALGEGGSEGRFDFVSEFDNSLNRSQKSGKVRQAIVLKMREIIDRDPESVARVLRTVFHVGRPSKSEE